MSSRSGICKMAWVFSGSNFRLSDVSRCPMNFTLDWPCRTFARFTSTSHTFQGRHVHFFPSSVRPGDSFLPFGSRKFGLFALDRFLSHFLHHVTVHKRTKLEHLTTNNKTCFITAAGSASTRSYVICMPMLRPGDYAVTYAVCHATEQ